MLGTCLTYSKSETVYFLDDLGDVLYEQWDIYSTFIILEDEVTRSKSYHGDVNQEEKADALGKSR